MGKERQQSIKIKNQDFHEGMPRIEEEVPHVHEAHNIDDIEKQILQNSTKKLSADYISEEVV